MPQFNVFNCASGAVINDIFLTRLNREKGGDRWGNSGNSRKI